jgi:hypothetical protein
MFEIGPMAEFRSAFEQEDRGLVRFVECGLASAPGGISRMCGQIDFAPAVCADMPEK